MDINHALRISNLVLSITLGAHLFNASASENSILCVPCQPGWFLFGENCYKLLGRIKEQNWKNSREKCFLEGGHLATIHSKELQDFLAMFLVSSTQKDAWIGMHDQINKSSFSLDDGSNLNYTNEDEYRPFSTPRESEKKDCVEMVFNFFKKSYEIVTWNNQRCDIRLRPYLCQVNKSVGTNFRDPRFCSFEDGGGWKFFRSCYHIVKEEKSWECAERYCKEKFGGNLVTILKDSYEMFINYILQSYLPNKDVWIGIKMKSNVAQQVWSSGWIVAYENWNRERLLFESGYCALKSNQSSWDSWEVSPCFKKYPFICEKRIDVDIVYQTPPSDDWKCPNSSEKWLDPEEEKRSLEKDSCCYTETEKSQNWLEMRDECEINGGIPAGAVVGIIFCALLIVLLVGVIVFRNYWKRRETIYNLRVIVFTSTA